MDICLYQEALIDKNTIPAITTIEQFVQDVKSGRWEDAVKDIRNRLANAKSAKERGDIKKKLPNVTISGTFRNGRTENDLIQHSGFIAIDFDKLSDIDNVFKKLSEDQYTYALFRSVSGTGLCCLVKIPVINHIASFHALHAYYLRKYTLTLDEKCKNVSRLRYVSHDPNLFYNPDSQVYTHTLEQHRHQSTEPQYDSSNIEVSVKYIEENKIDITKDYNDWLTIGFSFATEFGEEGRELFHRISSISEKYDQNDCDKKFTNCLQTTKKEVTIGTFFHYCHQNNIPTPQTRPDSQFWMTTAGKLTIHHDKLITFLASNGFMKLYYSDNDYKFIRVVDNVVEEVSIARIKDFIKDFVGSITGVIATGRKRDEEILFYPRDLKDAIISNARGWFSQEKLEFLPNIDVNLFVKGLARQHAFFFKNGFVIVTADGWQLMPYSALDKYIWKNQIIQRSLTISSPLDTLNTSVFYQFVRRICSLTRQEIDNNPNDDKYDSKETRNKIKSLMTIYGYLLHEYNSGKKKAVFWTDDNPNDDVAEGRSGKSLAAMALEHLRDLLNINGKSFKYDHDFKYQRASLSTQIILLNDIKKSFNVEDMFHDITESVEINKKNRDQFTIRPKFIITANKIMKGVGGSFRDRLIEFEFSSYFSDKWSPLQEFKQWFFTDWKEDEWNRFYNFMFMCCKAYLYQYRQEPESNGLYATASANLELKKLKGNTSEEFLIFMTDCLEEVVHGTQKGMGLDETTIGYGIRLNKWIFVDQWYKEFLKNFPEQTKTCSTSKKFIYWVRAYADAKRMNYEYKRSNGKGLAMLSYESISDELTPKSQTSLFDPGPDPADLLEDTPW